MSIAIKRRINPRNLNEFAIAVEEESGTISQNVINNFIKSMPNRVSALIRSCRSPRRNPKVSLTKTTNSNLFLIFTYFVHLRDSTEAKAETELEQFS